MGSNQVMGPPMIASGTMQIYRQNQQQIDVSLFIAMHRKGSYNLESKAFVDLVGRGGATEIEKMRLEQIRKLNFQNSNNLKFIPHEEQKQ